jgi:hypothetical protein
MKALCYLAIAAILAIGIVFSRLEYGLPDDGLNLNSAPRITP